MPKQSVLGFYDVIACIQQEKAASAVGALSHTASEAALAKGGCLLVSDNSSYRNRLAEELGITFAKIGCTVFHAWKHRGRYIEYRQ